MPKLSLNASKKTKQTPAGEIPVDWGWARLGATISSTQLGGNYAGSNQFEGAPLMKMGNMLRGFFTVKSFERLASEQEINPRDVLHDGDLLLNTRNTLELVGKVALWRSELVGAVFNSNMMRLAPGREKIDSTRFLNYVLNSEYCLREIRNRATGTTSVAAIYWRDLATIPIPLPPIPEQRRIADILSTWDRAIETLESLIAAKSRRKQALMQQLLSGKKRLPGFSGRWSVRHLGDVAENISQRNNGIFSWDRLYAVTKADGMVPMRAQVMGVTTNNCKLVKRNFFAYNPMRLNIGSLARWQRDEEVMVSGDYIVFQCKEGELEPRFFDHLRRTTQWHDFVNVGGSGSVRVRLYFKDIAPFKFPCPEFKEQKALSDFFDTIDRELTLHRQHLATLRTQKRGLMQKLLTGEVRLKA
jgi:type I restriction enzyme S subunit